MQNVRSRICALSVGKALTSGLSIMQRTQLRLERFPRKVDYHRYRIPRRSRRQKKLRFPAVGIQDEYGGRIIESFTDIEGDYELLK